MPIASREVLAFVLWVALTLSSYAQAATGLTADQPWSEDLVRWSVTQGGLLVALLAVSWMYIRDLKSTLREDQQHVMVLTTLVGDVRSALMAQTSVAGTQAIAIAELRQALDALKTEVLRDDRHRGGSTP